jgi:hypothetical protein
MHHLLREQTLTIELARERDIAERLATRAQVSICCACLLDTQRALCFRGVCACRTV